MANGPPNEKFVVFMAAIATIMIALLFKINNEDSIERKDDLSAINNQIEKQKGLIIGQYFLTTISVALWLYYFGS